MTDRRIMYVCTDCADHYPEGCGHYDRNDLAVMPDGAWLCESCADEPSTLEAHGAKKRGEGDDAEWPAFNDLPKPPQYDPA